MKNKKNKKGEIATFLTLGIILVGAVLTIATSFFANKTKNLTSNPKAAGSCLQGKEISGTTSQTCSDICGGYNNYLPNSQWIEGTKRFCCCKVSVSNGTQCEYITESFCKNKCQSKQCTNEGCGTDSNGNQTYRCISNQIPDKDASAYCSDKGGVAVKGVGCYDVCKGKNMKYIPNSQKIFDGINYCCCKETDVSQGFDTCYKAYQPGYYGCRENKNKVVVYAQSMSAVGMTSCEAYNKGSTTALYFAGKPGQYTNGECYNIWDGNMDLSAKNQQANNLKNTPTPIRAPAPKCAKEGEYSYRGLPCCDGLEPKGDVTASGTSFAGIKCVEKTTSPSGGETPAKERSNEVESNFCTPKNCRTLDSRYANKNYYELNGKFYEDVPCLETKIIPEDKLSLFCATQTVGWNFGAALDNSCVQKTGNPLAYCSAHIAGPLILPAKHFQCKEGYEFSDKTCNDYGMLCCVPKKDAQSCVKKACKDINSSYISDKNVYEKNSAYYKNLTDCSDGNNSISDIVMYCNQSIGIQASADNSCKQQTGDPKAYCNNIGPFGLNSFFTINLPCKSGFQYASARCGFPSTNCCVQKRQQTQSEIIVTCNSVSYDEAGNLICNQ